MPFEQIFPDAAPGAVRLLERMLVLDPQARPTATELLADPYFASYCDPDSETCAVPVCRADYAFDRLNRALTLDEVHTNIIRKGGGGGGHESVDRSTLALMTTEPAA